MQQRSRGVRTRRIRSPPASAAYRAAEAGGESRLQDRAQRCAPAPAARRTQRHASATVASLSAETRSSCFPTARRRRWRPRALPGCIACMCAAGSASWRRAMRSCRASAVRRACGAVACAGGCSPSFSRRSSTRSDGAFGVRCIILRRRLRERVQVVIQQAHGDARMNHQQ
jgi:hypothetical protein